MATETQGFPSLADQAESVGRALLVVFLAFVGALVLTGLVGNALLGAGLISSDGLAGRVFLSVLQFLGFGLGVGAYLRATGDWDLLRVRVPGLRDVVAVVVGVLVILLAAAGIQQLLTVFQVEVAQNQVITTGQSDPTYFLYMIPVSLLFVGPFEELVFRGGVQRLLRRTYGPWPAVLLASALFGLTHWIALTGGGGGRFAYIAVAAVLGVVLGVAYELTDNLVVPAAVHGIYNAVLFSVQYAGATGML
jgi:hypothetical protein